MTVWTAGQQVALNRAHIVTIDRVTPSGRACIGERVFYPDGREREAESTRVWGVSGGTIEVLTPAIIARVQLGDRWEWVSNINVGQAGDVSVEYSDINGVWHKAHKLTPDPYLPSYVATGDGV